MTEASSQDTRSSASMAIFAAQMYLVPDPEMRGLVDTLSEVREALQPPRLRLIEGGGGDN
jgi:hypothetical protein